jgi:hypothetical protein
MIATPGRTTRLRAIGAALLVLTLSSTTEANPIEVPLDPYPVILAGFLEVSYKAATDTFLASGWTASLDRGEGQTDLFDSFVLTATIDSSGAMSGVGSLMIGTDGALLRGSLVQFGADPGAGGRLQFLFGSPAGSLVTDGTFLPKPISVMFTGLTSAYPGSWNNDWTSNYNATAEVRSDDPAPVPEPSTLLLLLTAAGGIGARRRFRRMAA